MDTRLAIPAAQHRPQPIQAPAYARLNAVKMSSPTP